MPLAMEACGHAADANVHSMSHQLWVWTCGHEGELGPHAGHGRVPSCPAPLVGMPPNTRHAAAGQSCWGA